MKKGKFWVIDTDTPGMSEGQFSAFGPYKTQAAAERFIKDDAKELWEGSCACLQTDNKTPWGGIFHIVKVVRSVETNVEGKVTLTDVP